MFVDKKCRGSSIFFRHLFLFSKTKTTLFFLVMVLWERNQNLTREKWIATENWEMETKSLKVPPAHLLNFSTATHFLWPQAICLRVSCVRPVDPFASFFCSSALLMSSLFSETFPALEKARRTTLATEENKTENLLIHHQGRLSPFNEATNPQIQRSNPMIDGNHKGTTVRRHGRAWRQR